MMMRRTMVTITLAMTVMPMTTTMVVVLIATTNTIPMITSGQRHHRDGSIRIGVLARVRQVKGALQEALGVNAFCQRCSGGRKALAQK